MLFFLPSFLFSLLPSPYSILFFLPPFPFSIVFFRSPSPLSILFFLPPFPYSFFPSFLSFPSPLSPCRPRSGDVNRPSPLLLALSRINGGSLARNSHAWRILSRRRNTLLRFLCAARGKRNTEQNLSYVNRTADVFQRFKVPEIAFHFSSRSRRVNVQFSWFSRF